MRVVQDGVHVSARTHAVLEHLFVDACTTAVNAQGQPLWVGRPAFMKGSNLRHLGAQPPWRCGGRAEGVSLWEVDPLGPVRSWRELAVLGWRGGGASRAGSRPSWGGGGPLATGAVL
eukprot:179896-Chlamydomonas_euryale.AAC.1